MAGNGTQTDQLTSRQRRAIAALLSARNVEEAARQANVGERSLWRWLADPAFRSAVLSAEGEAIDQAARRLIGMQDEALNVFQDVLGSKAAGSALRLRAAQNILDYLLKLRELRNVEQRVKDLEERVYGNTKQTTGQPGRGYRG